MVVPGTETLVAASDSGYPASGQHWGPWDRIDQPVGDRNAGSLGRLSPRGTPETWLSELIETSGVIVKDLTCTIAVLSTQFPRDFPSDPADRLIAATARAEGLTLVTRDSRIRASTLLKTVW